MKFSLKWLLAAVAYVAFALAAMIGGTWPWAIAAATLTFVLLLVATVASGVVGRSKRPFWFGFCVFGWAYVLVLLAPPSIRAVRPSAG